MLAFDPAVAPQDVAGLGRSYSLVHTTVNSGFQLLIQSLFCVDSRLRGLALTQTSQFAPAEEVKVEVGYLLAGLNAGVYHQSIAFFGHTLIFR